MRPASFPETRDSRDVDPRAIGRLLNDMRETHVKPWETRAFRAAITGAWLLAATAFAPLLLPDTEWAPGVLAVAALLAGLLALVFLGVHRLSRRGHEVVRRRLEGPERKES
jgi:hypothetical protein